MKKTLSLLAACALTGVIIAAAQADAPTCVTSILNSAGHVIGEAKLTQTSKGVLVQATASNIAEGWHGFHLHSVGKCEGPDFKSAGGHFNPGNVEHGFKTEHGGHAGDMPNVYVGRDGKLTAEFLAEDVTLEPGKANSLLDADGSALVIHGKKDDYVSQPAGDAGDRIGCAVIQ